jgi:hypothetical protein
MKIPDTTLKWARVKIATSIFKQEFAQIITVSIQLINQKIVNTTTIKA